MDRLSDTQVAVAVKLRWRSPLRLLRPVLVPRQSSRVSLSGASLSRVGTRGESEQYRSYALVEHGHLAVRSRLVKISSHAASRSIGLPHIKIDLDPPVGVAEAGGEAITLMGSISRDASLESSAPVAGARSVAAVMSCNRGRGRRASALTGLI
jgi:hypothetical protein